MANQHTNITIKGIGSFFPTIAYQNKTFNNHISNFNPVDKHFFYTGRQAIKYVVELIKLKNKPFTLWLPEYYCMHVTKWLRSNYSNIKTYKTNPSNPSFKIDAFVFASDNDVVLVNNYWGIDDCSIDIGDKKITTIEDHSHGWLSEACTNSKADFCIASLRKSLPIPLGGIAWSPKKLNLNKNIPRIDSKAYEAIWDKTDAGMKLKKNYEITNNIKFKDESLKLIQEAEKDLHENFDLTRIHSDHTQIINKFSTINYLKFKSKNLNALYNTIVPNQHFNILKHISKTSFGLTLHFNNIESLQTIRTILIKNSIYPSILWPDNDINYGFYLNIHVDYRYHNSDMAHIAKTLNSTL